jgi:hypothetical protein
MNLDLSRVKGLSGCIGLNRMVARCEAGARSVDWLGHRRGLAGPCGPYVGEGQLGQGWDSAHIT